MNDAMTPLSPQAEAETWLAAFAQTLTAHTDLTHLLTEDPHWRDVLAFTGSITTTSGPAIAEILRARLAHTRPTNFHIPADRTPPRRVTRAGVAVTELLFAFETAQGLAHGAARLIDGRAWTLLTALDSLHGFPEPTTGPHAIDADYSRDFGGENWLDKRTRARAYTDRDPAALIVGAGQAGLALAARLTRLGVDTLVVDRESRIGDNWRRRYHALTLHNEVHVNHLPYMPFPPTWPVFIPKDKLANWFEAYAEAMDLNIWTSTSLKSGHHDGETWHLTLAREDGTTREIHPRHLIFATGVSSIPVIPDLPGLATFAGTKMHSGAYTEGSQWRGKRAIVLGTGNSAHDVAQDLHCSGAHVTMIQRSPTYVVSLPEAQSVYAIYKEGIPIADCDILATAMPYPILRKAYQLSTAASRATDKPLLDRLAARGFRLDFGSDDTGFQMKYLRRGGGYYFNVGCSDLIANGDIALIQFDTIDRFTPEGLRLHTGETMKADLLVLATGYKNQQETIRATLGDEIAERIGPVWGFDDAGELRNMWRETAQPGLWFTAGSLAQCRIWSKFLAIQIKAREIGVKL